MNHVLGSVVVFQNEFHPEDDLVDTIESRSSLNYSYYNAPAQTIKDVY